MPLKAVAVILPVEAKCPQKAAVTNAWTPFFRRNALAGMRFSNRVETACRNRLKSKYENDCLQKLDRRVCPGNVDVECERTGLT